VSHLVNSKSDGSSVTAPAPHEEEHEEHDNSPMASQTIPVIKYTIRGQATLLNHWQYSRYFLAAFPTLFPMGVGGHLDDRPVPVSAAAFADWALRHHSRRHVSLHTHANRS
jgi:hypothetical protein